MMMPKTSGGNRQTLAGDAGYAMVVVMGIIAVLTVIAFGGFAMSQQALHEAGVNRQESQAFQAANGALDAAIANVRLNRGGVGNGFTMNFTAAQLGSGSASVTAEPVSAHEISLTSVGHGADGSAETIRTRIWVMDIYGMNIAASAGFNSSAAGKFNGNASVFGPFYTHGSLRQGDNLGNSVAGGFNWGPIFTYEGTVRVKDDFLKSVNFLYYDPDFGAPTDVSRVLGGVIPSVPRIELPRVDGAYLNERYDEAVRQSTDNRRGDGLDSNTEWNSVTRTYTGTRAPGARADAYKVIDGNGVLDGSLGGTPFVIGGTTAFGGTGHDFSWDPEGRILTVWGTVFIDGPLEFRGGGIRYVGNGIIVANGNVTFVQTDFVPASGLEPALPPSHVQPQTMLANQKFRPDEVIGIATPGRIILSRSSSGNRHGAESLPTHAGAFFAGEQIQIGYGSGSDAVTVVGSVISEGIEIGSQNNMDLRTSPNLGDEISDAMPGSGMVIVSMGGWARQ